MLVIAGLILGALWGQIYARRGKGTRFDLAQYTIALAILGGILGLFATLIIDRLL